MRPIFSLLVFFAATGPALGCAVCFGADDPNLAKGYLLAIGVLLGFTFLILAALVYAVYRIEMNRAALQAAGPWHRNGSSVRTAARRALERL